MELDGSGMMECGIVHGGDEGDDHDGMASFLNPDDDKDRRAGVASLQTWLGECYLNLPHLG